MGKAGEKKKNEIDAHRKISVHIYNLRIKIDTAINKGIHYGEVGNVEITSWKIIDFLVDHEIDWQNNLKNNDENADGKFPKTGKWKKKLKDANKKISKCLDDLTVKLEEATQKDICFTKLSGLDEVSWKFIDCLAEDEIVDARVQLARKLKKTKQESPVVCHVQRSRTRTRTPLSSEKQRRSKSLPRNNCAGLYQAANDCQKTLNYKEEKSDYMFDTDINLNRCHCPAAQKEDNYKQDISSLKNALKEVEEHYKTQYESVAQDCINKYQDFKKKTDRERKELLQMKENNKLLNEENESLKAEIYELENSTPTACCECERMLQHMMRYKAERNNLKLDNERLGTQIQKILNERADKTLSLTSESMEKTIESQKKLISEILKREKQLQDKLDGAEHDLSYITNLLENCKKEKNDVKTKLSKYEIENDTLQCEKDHLQKTLKKQKQQAKEQMEKEKDLLQQKPWIDELNKKLDEIEKKRDEIPLRDKNELRQEQENNRNLNEENEKLRAEIYELEDKLVKERKEQIESEHKYKVDINNLRKIQNKRADEKIREVERDFETINSKFKEQQDLLSAERCRFEEELKELRLRLDEKSSKSVDNKWSRSATCKREIIYKTGDEGFMDMFKRSPSSLQERDTSAGSKSDTEKENISLKSELTVALENIEKFKQEYKDLAERYEREMKAVKMTIDSLQREKNFLETEKVNWKAKLDQIQSDVNLFKHEQVNQQESTRGKMDNLLQQNRKLENDKGLLRDRIYSLEKENVKLKELEKRLHTSTEEQITLQREKDNLQHKLAEKSSQLKITETRSMKLDTDHTLLENLRTENEDLKVSLKDVKRELDTLEKRYKKETADRICFEKTSTKLKDENDRLRRERNFATAEQQKLLREKEESSLNLNAEKVFAQEELQKKEKEKSDLVGLFREDKEKDSQKIQRLELEIDSLKSRFSTGEKASQYNAYELLQNKNDLETCKHQKKALEDECNELQKENVKLENQIESLSSKQFDDHEKKESQLKKQIKDLEAGYRNAISKLHEAEKQMQEKNETIEDQKEENRKINKDKKDLENKLRLALNNEKQASLGKECEDLKILLQQKQKELNNLKSRFQELADSKETSEVLNKIIENLQQEKSDLNQRLQELEVLKRQVNKLDFENSELKKRLHQYEDKFEDIPALKRHMNTLQSDNDELNLKLQEYAAELEGIPSLKRRIENLQTDNAKLEKRDKHKDGLLQKSESTVQKMQKDNQKLQTEIISQNQNYDTLKIKLESLKDKNLELDERLRRRSPVVVAEPKNCQNCFKYRNDISDLKREINDLRDRLSEAAGNKLRDNNPNIADLSDMNRPTSLAEKFSSLYTDEYTDAMEVIEDDMDEAASVKVMLDWLKSCYDWCQRLAKEQRETLINRSIGFMQEHGGQKVVLSDRCLIFVKEFQKKIAVESLAVVGQICHVKSVTQQTLSRENYIVKYIKKCSELCWMMQISDPPLYVNFDVNSGENLNKNDYNVFTKSGSKIDYLVWPVLYLHKTGPMLAKGVAQGK